MHQTKKGNPWHFGCKVHVGTDAASGLAHSVVGRPANVHDVTQTHALLLERRATSWPMRATRAWTSARRSRRDTPR